jgi:hypothetical protein
VAAPTKPAEPAPPSPPPAPATPAAGEEAPAVDLDATIALDMPRPDVERS